MVKVAIAGANSGLALEVIDALAEGGHEVIALTRKDPSTFPQQTGVTWVKTTYQDKAELVKLFAGVSAVLNFIVVHNDPGNETAKLLIAAAIEAGVRRYAPSEWSMGQKLPEVVAHVPWYQGKLDARAYLREINKDKKVIEYSLFHPGIFLEPFAYPKQIGHVPATPIQWQLHEAHLVDVRGNEDKFVTVTSAHDIAGVVRRAVEYEGVWPEVGGIQGGKISTNQLKALIEAHGTLPAGKTEVEVELAEEADLAKGELKVHIPLIEHPSIPEDQREAWHTPAWSGLLLANAKGGWNATDEWNKLLPDYKFQDVEEFIKKEVFSK